jgi:hypothetical protein
VLTISLSACSTTRSPERNVSPLVVASCPELTPLTDNSFGAVVSKLAEVAGIYNECRQAALAESK